jgi:citrate lyase subunit beta/citryl-CoA lyase
LAAPALAAAGNCAGLMWGSEDLLADLGGRPGRTPSGTYLPAMEEARTRILYAARAAGVMPMTYESDAVSGREGTAGPGPEDAA